MEWLKENKQWLFGGVLASIIGALVTVMFHRSEPVAVRITATVNTDFYEA